MKVRFTQSARKHRIGRAHVYAAMEAADPPQVRPAVHVGEDDRLLFIGIDDRGLELEIIAIQRPEYLLVIHVMPTALRRKSS